ncbi:MAG: transporter related [Anaerocolumna sp.]|nr:transporter related [Anaerocolumna sp.]
MDKNPFKLNKNAPKRSTMMGRVKSFSVTNQTNKECGLHCIRTEHIGVKLGNQTILEDINLHIHCKELTAVIGRNGAGKSTLIKAMLGEIKHEGSISFKDIRNNEFGDLKIGYVPQNLNIAKNTPTSVYDLFASYISNIPVFLSKNKKLYDKIKEQLKIFEAQELIDKAVCDLSGGELQRVLLSIAVTPVPNLLLLDEPVSGIDQNGMELFYKNIQKLKEEYDLAIILISHDFNFVRKYADRVVLLDKTIVKEGSAEDVLSSKEFNAIFGTTI